MNETGNMAGVPEKIVDKEDDRSFNDANSVPNQFGNVYGILDHTSFQSNTNVNAGNSVIFDHTVYPTPQERKNYLQMGRIIEAHFNERERPISNRPDLNHSRNTSDDEFLDSSEVNLYNPYAQNRPMQSELDRQYTQQAIPNPIHINPNNGQYNPSHPNYPRKIQHSNRKGK